MKLSVNVITYNRKDELLRALQSLINQTFNDYEIIIIDNASTDGTDDAINMFKEKHKKLQISYEKQNSNLGVSGGRNRAFMLSNGEYIFTFDDDAIIEDRDFFVKAIQKLDEDTSICAAAVNIFEPHVNEYLPYSISKIKEDKNVLSYNGGANFLRKDFFRNRILYPEKLFFGSEELYPSLIAWGKGKRVAYFDDLEVLHLPSKVNRYIGKDRTMNFLVNTYIIHRLVYPCISVPLLNLFLFFRLFKHGMIQDIKKVRLLYKERYDSEEQFRMNIKGVIKLIRMFGLKRTF